MKPKLALVALLLLLPSLCGAMARFQGDCTKGGQTVTTGGVAAPQFVMRSFVNSSLGVPTSGCTVTVYTTGTLSLALLYSDSFGTPLANPFTADVTGHFYFYTGDGNYDIQLSGAGLGSPYTLGAEPVMDPFFTQVGSSVVSRSYLTKVREIYSLEDFTGGDCGAQLNNAYSQLGSGGGTILVHTSCSFTTPIVFGTNNKPVIVTGIGQGLTMTYTPTSGTAVNFNNGTSLQSQWNNITLIGPGNGVTTGLGNSALGLVNGGSNGGNVVVNNSIIKTFSNAVKLANNGSNLVIINSHLQDSEPLFWYPASLTNSGAALNWRGVVFDGIPNAEVNSVYMEGAAGKLTCTDCSFFNANLTVGNNTGGYADVTVVNGKFENTGYASNPTGYTYATVLFNAYNNVKFIGTTWLQDNPSYPFAYFNSLAGGIVSFTNCALKSASGSIPAFNNLAFNVAIVVNGFNDITGSLVTMHSGGTTGWITQTGAQSLQGPTYFNNFTSRGSVTLTGSHFYDIQGDIASSGQLISTASTGTPPLAVSSTDMVGNLHAQMELYTPGTATTVGTAARQTANNHEIIGQGTFAGGGTNTYTLTGTAVYTSASSYVCNAVTTTSNQQIHFNGISGSSFTLTGQAGATFSYRCSGY